LNIIVIGLVLILFPEFHMMHWIVTTLNSREGHPLFANAILIFCLHYFPQTKKKSLISQKPINTYLLWFEHYSKLHFQGLQDWTLWAAHLTRCFSVNIIKSFQCPIYNWLGAITLTSYLMFDTKPDTNHCNLT
jgi:hypothetical protein